MAEIGRYDQASDVTLTKWRDAFLTGGAAALAKSGLGGQPSRTTFATSVMKQCLAGTPLIGVHHRSVSAWPMDEPVVEVAPHRTGMRCVRG